MRKGAQKKKERQLEELLLDRREALGELVLGMYVRNSWDDDLLARGSAEVADVENELNELIAGREPEGISATEKDFPVTGEHRLPFADDEPMTGEYTAEHAVPETGEYTQEHSVTQVFSPETSEYTSEHVLPGTGEHTAEHQVAEEPPAKPSRAERKRAKKERKEQERQEQEAAEKQAAQQAPPQEAPKPTIPAPSEPVAPPVSSPTPAPVAASPPATPSSTPPTPPESEPKPQSVSPPETAKKPIDVPAPPVAAPQPTDPLDILNLEIDEREATAKSALDTAKATLKADAKTELTAIARDVESGQKELDAALASAAAAIQAAETKATQAEARLARETAANRESAAEWVRGQAAEIEADAALASEMSGDEPAPAQSGDPDPVLTARITSLEAELAAEKASKDEALTKAAARLKEIEESAKLAEARVEAAEHSAKEAKAEADVRTASNATAAGQATEAENREAAVNWLRGQIGALRQEIAADDKKASDGGGS